MAKLSRKVEDRLDAARVSHTRRELMRDFLTAAMESDPAVDVRLGDDGWKALDMSRSGQHIARIFTIKGIVQIKNYLPDHNPNEYGDHAILNHLNQWKFIVKSEADADVMLRCLSENITHLGERRAFCPVSRAKGAGTSPRSISSKKRFSVLFRDNFMCQYCGRHPPEVTLHVDHRKPVSRGGGDELDNLLTACQDCNLGKSDAFTT